ncbi:hypothetical protein HHI36_002252, partial [Cryptolaemus montrouzieri]
MWITQDFLKLPKERDKLYKLHKQNTADLNTKIKLAEIKSKIASDSFKLKNSYFMKEMAKAGTDSRKQWRLINKFHPTKKQCIDRNCSMIEINGIEITSAAEIVHKFIEYFIN